MVMAQAHNIIQADTAAADSWLSALMDGEMDDTQAGRSIGLLGKDADAMRIWSEYGLIGDAMRGCVPDTCQLNQRIKAALAAEPTILAPVAKPPRQSVYWVAAAAAVVAITWTVLSVSPVSPGVPVAANGQMAAPQVAKSSPVRSVSAVDVASNNVAPYLEAHQDYAFTVAGEPDMQFTKISLSGNAP
jgi:negative regulator of sigma E activity